jgi:hypothetical protein
MYQTSWQRLKLHMNCWPQNISFEIDLGDGDIEEINYFAYFVGCGDPKGLFKRGEVGVGYTHLSPGIRDCRYGTLYVIPGSFIKIIQPQVSTIRRNVLLYYGVK